MSPPLGPVAGERSFGWYRVSVRPLARPRRGASLWTVADITAERERQENVFQELQHAIDYLDHAPAGFLSIDPAGAIVYMNATLAAWLGYDLASVGHGGPHLTEIAPEADVLVRAAGLPGEVRTDRFDLDLRRRNGHTLPVRLYHRIAFGKDGKPGSSRTFVINRSAGAESDEPQRAAEVRLARFLNNSPIAIATLDRTGRIARANASFTRLFGTAPRQAEDGALDGDGTARAEPNVADSVTDRTALEAGLARAASGRTDPEPIEVPAQRSGRPLRAGLAQPGRWRRSGAEDRRGRAGDPVRPRHHGPAPAGAAGRPGPEDERRGPARRRHRPRLQQRAAGDHRLFGPTPGESPADRSGLPGHHADQAERQPGGGPRPPAPGVLPPPDPASGGDECRGGALGTDPAAQAPARRAGRPGVEARPRSLAREGRRQPVRAGDRESRGQRPGCDAGGRQAGDPHRERHRSGAGLGGRGTRRGRRRATTF